jgi:prevent-host-death family protein
MTNDNFPQIDASTARAKLNDLVNRVAFGGEVVIITRYGKPSVAMVSVERLKEIVGDS